MSPAPKPQRSLPVFWIAIGALIAVVGGAIAISAIGGGDTKKPGDGTGDISSSREYGTVKVAGTALPTLGDGADPADGTTIPTVSGESFTGEPVVIEPNGLAQMIVFLAHWCPHCNAEAPRLAEYLTQNNGVPNGTDLVIVPTGSNQAQDNWPPSRWVEDMGLGDVATLVDDQDGTAARAFGLSSYPFIVMVDGDGKVVARRAGEQPDGFFASAFAALAKGAPIPN